MDRPGVNDTGPRTGCNDVEPYLVSYHLGDLDGDARDTLEEHLTRCSACLKTYLALKRTADRAAFDRPRPEVKARLRAEVERLFPTEKPRKVAVLARPVPLYQGVALAAIAAAIALAAPAVLRRVTSADGAAGTPSIDTSRTRAESLRIF
jgi:anti-sigma factor RsiW